MRQGHQVARAMGLYSGVNKPAIQSVAESNGVITVTYQAGISVSGTEAGFSFTASGGALTIGLGVPINNTMVLTLNRNPASNETVTMTYQRTGDFTTDVHQPVTANQHVAAYAKNAYNVPVTVT